MSSQRVPVIVAGNPHRIVWGRMTATGTLIYSVDSVPGRRAQKSAWDSILRLENEFSRYTPKGE